MPVRRLRTEVPNPDIHHDLPPNLNIKLGDCIGHGRSGITFKVEPVGLSSSTSSTVLPPLVAKIGRQHFNKWLLREAWFYEEMQSVQGVVIPWCYGLYSARIPPGHAFLPWLEGWRLREFSGQDVDPDVLLQSYKKGGGKDKADEREIQGELKMLDYFGNFDEHHADFVQKFEDKNGTVVCTLLILEALGGPYLPVGKQIAIEMRYVT